MTYRLHSWLMKGENGAPDGSLLELFNKILHPVLTSSKEVLLYFEIENFINGLEKSKPIIYNKDTGW